MPSVSLSKTADNDGHSLESQESSARLYPREDENYYAGARADTFYRRSDLHSTAPLPNSGNATIRVDSVVTVTDRLKK